MLMLVPIRSQEQRARSSRLPAYLRAAPSLPNSPEVGSASCPLAPPVPPRSCPGLQRLHQLRAESAWASITSPPPARPGQEGILRAARPGAVRARARTDERAADWRGPSRRASLPVSGGAGRAGRCGGPSCTLTAGWPAAPAMRSRQDAAGARPGLGAERWQVLPGRGGAGSGCGSALLRGAPRLRYLTSLSSSLCCSSALFTGLQHCLLLNSLIATFPLFLGGCFLGFFPPYSALSSHHRPHSLFFLFCQAVHMTKFTFNLHPGRFLRAG